MSSVSAMLPARARVVTRVKSVPAASNASTLAFRHAAGRRAAVATVARFQGRATSRPASGAAVIRADGATRRDVRAGAISDPAAERVEIPANSALNTILRSNAGAINKIMCANRGEIAVRTFRAGTELGMRTVAVFSEADRLATHRYKADESYCVNPGETPVGAYLGYEGIIECAKKNGVQAIHPGTASSRRTLCRALREEGIVFIGPRSETITQMGDKVIAKSLAKECGLPLVPGTEEATDDVEAAEALRRSWHADHAQGGNGRGRPRHADRADHG